MGLAELRVTCRACHSLRCGCSWRAAPARKDENADARGCDAAAACLYVPHAHTLVEGGGEHEVVPGVEAGRHDVVVVAG